MKENGRTEAELSSSSSSSSSSSTHDSNDANDELNSINNPDDVGGVMTLEEAADEDKLCAALGISPSAADENDNDDEEEEEEDEEGDVTEVEDGDGEVTKDETSREEECVPNPEADEVDLSVLMGFKNVVTAKETMQELKAEEKEGDLTALAELVPGLINSGTHSAAEHAPDETSDNASYKRFLEDKKTPSDEPNIKKNEDYVSSDSSSDSSLTTMKGDKSSDGDKSKQLSEFEELDIGTDHATRDFDEKATTNDNISELYKIESEPTNSDIASRLSNKQKQKRQNSSSNNCKSSSKGAATATKTKSSPSKSSKQKDTASISTSTVATHEVRMPMYLPTFKPATGCTNASDFIVRCFVARLRAGITVVKHGRSRWCKSRLRILHVHSDGRSLSWKPAMGEPTSSKRPPKLDLSTCAEVRHAWSSDPLNPMFTGTPILRQKCEAANAHKSFALVFPKRTVDITAITADQCKVLMEGFSALCFRLQVASLAGKKQLSAVTEKGKKERNGGVAEGDADERSTASNTLTNNSTTSPTMGVAAAAAVRRSAYR